MTIPVIMWNLQKHSGLYNILMVLLLCVFPAGNSPDYSEYSVMMSIIVVVVFVRKWLISF